MQIKSLTIDNNFIFPDGKRLKKIPARIAPTIFPRPRYEKIVETSATETLVFSANEGKVGPVIDVKKPCAIRQAACFRIFSAQLKFMRPANLGSIRVFENR